MLSNCCVVVFPLLSFSELMLSFLLSSMLLFFYSFAAFRSVMKVDLEGLEQSEATGRRGQQ